MFEYKPKNLNSSHALDRAIASLGQQLRLPLHSIKDMDRLAREGIAPDALNILIDAGFSKSELSWIVQPRTLSHRQKRQERLTLEESGRWMRAAKLHALAVHVLGSEDKANVWMHKPRKAFDGLSAAEAMKTEPGGQLVEEHLLQLDSGFYA